MRFVEWYLELPMYLRSTGAIIAIAISLLVLSANKYVSRALVAFFSALSQLFGVFFFVPAKKISDPAMDTEIIYLKHRLAKLQSFFADPTDERRQDVLREIAKEQIDAALPNILVERFDDINATSKLVDFVLEKSVKRAVSEFLTEYTPETLLALRAEETRATRREKADTDYDKTIETELATAATVRRLMVNLFITVNLGLLLAYLAFGASLPDRLMTAALGLYISMAAFMIYIYRTTNFRTSVILSLREDAKKYFDATDYISRLSKDLRPTDRDIEILKILLVNRTEREKSASHPYEVIIKGVTNSTVLMSGAKVSAASLKEGKLGGADKKTGQA